MLKKFLSLFLSLLLLAVLVSCGGGSVVDATKSDTAETSNVQAESNEKLKMQIQNCTPMVDYPANTTVYQMDTVTFGTSLGKPIEWIVLEKKDNEALLLSKYLIDGTVYNNDYEDITWENCYLRNRINSENYGDIKFSEEEKSSILTTDVINSDNAKYGTKGGNDTKDKLFLLSVDEFNKFFSEGKQAEARQEGHVDDDVDSFEYDAMHQLNDWWLRSPGSSQKHAMYVDIKGALRSDDIPVGHGIRPALWVKY